MASLFHCREVYPLQNQDAFRFRFQQQPQEPIMLDVELMDGSVPAIGPEGQPKQSSTSYNGQSIKYIAFR